MCPFVTISVLIFWRLSISAMASYLLSSWPACSGGVNGRDALSIPGACAPCCPLHFCHEGVCPCKDKGCGLTVDGVPALCPREMVEWHETPG